MNTEPTFDQIIDAPAVLSAIEQATKKVGVFQKNKLADSLPIEKKSRFDLVSYVDKTSEEHFRTALEEILPEASFVGEETGTTQTESDFTWVVDPLDGTTNFIHHLPVFASSIALLYRGEPVIGVVHEYGRDEFYHAIKGRGAYMNHHKIQISKTRTLEDSLVATGFPYHIKDKLDGHLQLVKYCLENTRGIRRLGSAATDLAYLAIGRFELYYEFYLNIWDIAAGVLLVQEAGGMVSDFKGGDDYLTGKTILATNHRLHKSFLEQIDKNFYGK